MLEHSGARILCTVSSFLGNDYVALLRSALGGQREERPVAGPPALERMILAGDRPPGTENWSEFVARSIAIASTAATARRRAIRANDPCDILFTSGTTGRPKGVAIDASGADLAANQPDEVLIRGYNVLRGYLGDPSATAEVVDRTAGCTRATSARSTSAATSGSWIA